MKNFSFMKLRKLCLKVYYKLYVICVIANTYRKNSRTLRVACTLNIMSAKPVILTEMMKSYVYKHCIILNIYRYCFRIYKHYIDIVLELQPFFDLTQRVFGLWPIFCAD